MKAIKLGFDGGEPHPGTDGVGRVGGQEIDGGDPQPGTDDGGDPQLCIDASGKKSLHLQQKKRGAKQPQLEQQKSAGGNVTKQKKGAAKQAQLEQEKPAGGMFTKGDLPMGSKSASPLLRSPIQVTSSPGVNMLARSVAVKSASVIERSASIKRAKMTGSPKTSQHPPSFTQLSSPSLEDLSPGTRTTNSHASKRRRRKLISAIWREAEPIYKEGKLVEGRCIHCHQIFAASRDSGTNRIKRHLKVCDAKTSMSEMVDKMGQMEWIRIGSMIPRSREGSW
ncbi:hypothetical protein ACQ4PT_010158 [Festuca glaucescens]